MPSTIVRARRHLVPILAATFLFLAVPVAAVADPEGAIATAPGGSGEPLLDAGATAGPIGPSGPAGSLGSTADIGGAATTGGFAISFDAGVPASAQTALNAAAGIWGNALRPTTPVTLQVHWTASVPGGGIGYGQSNMVPPNTVSGISWWLPESIANQRLGRDVSPGFPDVQITLNSAANWYFGTDGRPPPGKIDLVSSAVHELGHGLGFISCVTSAGTGFSPGACAFDQNLINAAGTPIAALSPAGLAAALTSGVWDVSPRASALVGGPIPISTSPPPVASASHWQMGAPNDLMNAFQTVGVARQNIGPVVLARMFDLGWPDPNALPKPGAPTVSALASTTDITVTWTPATSGGTVADFVVASTTGGLSVTVPSTSRSFTFRNVASGAWSFTVTARNASGTATSSVSNTVNLSWTARYHPVDPSRLLDTRDGTGGTGPVGAKGRIDVQVTGRGGVPASGVSAVVLNLTAVGPTAPSHLTAYPSGEDMPLASNLNVVPGETVPNLVTVKVGASGRVTLFNNAGSVHLVADVAGWYDQGSGAGGAHLHSMTPSRLLDTRDNSVGLGPGEMLTVPVAGHDGVPVTGAAAAVLNVTAVNATASSHLTVFPTGQTPPLASNLNFTAGDTVPNLAIAKLGTDGAVTIRNNSGTVHVLVDVSAWFDDGTDPAGSGFQPTSPTRLGDTRSALGFAHSPVGAKTVEDLTVRGVNGVPADATAVALNVTVVGPTAASHLTVWPSGESPPLASNLNYTPGLTVANQVIVKIGANGKVSFQNNAGTAHIVVDLAGWYR